MRRPLAPLLLAVALGACQPDEGSRPSPEEAAAGEAGKDGSGENVNGAAGSETGAAGGTNQTPAQ